MSIDTPAISDGQSAAAYTYKKWGGPSRLVPPVTISVPTANSVRVALNNPKRMELVIVNVGTTNVWFDFNAKVTKPTGILLPSGGGELTLTVDEDGELVTYEVWMIAFFGANNVRVYEIERI